MVAARMGVLVSPFTTRPRISPPIVVVPFVGGLPCAAARESAASTISVASATDRAKRVKRSPVGSKLRRTYMVLPDRSISAVASPSLRVAAINLPATSSFGALFGLAMLRTEPMPISTHPLRLVSAGLAAIVALAVSAPIAPARGETL
jgi:hypothetical protein